MPVAEGMPPLLEGVKVVEFARLLAAPFCGLTLSDLGADVVKVESRTGDETRLFPPFLGGRESGFFHATNRGKRGVCLKIGDPRAIDVARRMIEQADVVIENLGESSDRLGVDYAEASRSNPKLVWCSVSGLGYGKGGRAVDPSIQADMGLMALTGEAGGPPVRVPVPLIDILTGMYAAQSVITALWRAEKFGQGQFLDCALLDSAATFTGLVATMALGGFINPRRMGSENYLLVPSAVFKTSDDEYIQTIAITEKQWHALCRALGHPEWIDDDRCKDNATRVINRDLVHGRIRETIATNTAEHWVRTISAADGICERVREIEEAFADERLYERELLATLDDPNLQNFPIPLLSMARTADVTALKPGPAIGQHTHEVLTELGMTTSQIDQLVADGVAYSAAEVPA